MAHKTTRSFPGGSVVKNLPVMQETWVQSLGLEDPLEKGMATHPSILAQRIPWTEEPGGLQSIASQRVRHDWAADTFSSGVHTAGLEHCSAAPWPCEPGWVTQGLCVSGNCGSGRLWGRILRQRGLFTMFPASSKRVSTFLQEPSLSPLLLLSFIVTSSKFPWWSSG